MPEWNVPGYTELRRIGSGGFGDVVLARHDESGTLVAIKYLRQDLLADPEFAEMFRGEAAVLASLDDPNVVRLYEYVESPAGAAIVMELVDGVSLREILTRQGATTAEAALVVLQGSLLGLAAAHARGVVHRDYKPENVLVNGAGVSKLTDFGIAARAGDRPIPAGTLAYAPPEQFSGSPASPAGDVYAATATFYECLTGHPPFTGDTAAQLLYQHLSEPVPLDPVPGPLRPLVTAGMAKDPAYRPADAGAFVTRLRTVAADAYGQDWEDRGRSSLGEAALLLAALWPSGAPPAVQGTAVRQVRLPRSSRESRESRHLWHLRHEAHLRHLTRLRALMAVAAAVAVGAVVAVVAVTTGSSHSPSGTGAGSSPSARSSSRTRTPLCDAASCQPGWSSPAHVAAGLITSVSCSGQFCAAVGATGPYSHPNGFAVTYSNGAWSAPVALGTGNRYTVSCPTETLCQAVTDTGYAYAYRNGAWSGADDIYPAANGVHTQITSADFITDASCGTPSFCVAETAKGDALTWNGTRWSAPVSTGMPGISAAPPFIYSTATTGLSCPTATYCLTGASLRDQPAAASGDGTSWSPTSPPPAVLANAFRAVSCPSAQFCMIVGGVHATGDISATWNGTTWSGLANPSSGADATGFTTVSCASTGFCAALDAGSGANGEQATTARGSGIFSWTNGAWDGPELIDPHGTLDALSCSPSGFCVAADTAGDIYTYTASTGPCPYLQVARAASAAGQPVTVQAQAAQPPQMVYLYGDMSMLASYTCLFHGPSAARAAQPQYQSSVFIAVSAPMPDPRASLSEIRQAAQASLSQTNNNLRTQAIPGIKVTNVLVPPIAGSSGQGEAISRPAA